MAQPDQPKYDSVDIFLVEFIRTELRNFPDSLTTDYFNFLFGNVLIIVIYINLSIFLYLYFKLQ